MTLRDATVLEPGGSRLTSGLAVAIVGHPDGNAFVADEVDAVPADAAPAYDILPASDAGAASYDVPTGAAYGTPYVGPDPVRRPQPISRSNGPGYATGTVHPSYGQTFRAAPPAQPAHAAAAPARSAPSGASKHSPARKFSSRSWPWAVPAVA